MSAKMETLRRALPLGLAACMVVVCVAMVLLLAWPPGERLSATARPGSSPRLPAGSVVGSVDADTVVVAPFAVAASAASPGGWAAALAEGQGDKALNAGQVSLPLQVAQAGRYRLWLRCRWSDSCGNSVGVTLGNEAPVTVGQDAVYDQWHWVDAGEGEHAAGQVVVTLHEREDGMAVDQALLCPAEVPFVPVGPIIDGSHQAAGVRRFADSFDRSPGHGTDGWSFETGTWELAFTLDPNRIPLQYALDATPPAGQWGTAMLAGQPWRGGSLGVSVYCERPGTAVGLLFRTAAGSIAVLPDSDQQVPELPGATVVRARDARLAPGQWYRLEAERWGWSLRLTVDGAEVCRHDGLATPEAGALGLVVAGGRAVFDDVVATEIPWSADDGRDFRLGWVPDPAAQWYRPRRADAGWSLLGRRGSIRADLAGVPAAEVLVEAQGASETTGLRLPGWSGESCDTGAVFRPTSAPTPDLHLDAARLCRLRRIVVRGQPPDAASDTYHLGVYHFSEANVPDIADYLDFTPEEYRQIAADPDVERLRRRAKEFEVVGSSSDYAIWAVGGGYWVVRDGVLSGTGPAAKVRFWQALYGPFQVRLRVCLQDAGSVVGLVLGETDGTGFVLRLAGPAAGEAAGPFATTVAPGEWHVLEADLTEHSLAWRVDSGELRSQHLARGTGGGVHLTVDKGRAEFDDVLFSVPRRVDTPQAHSRFYGFDRRETDWWRRGNWLDHGGIACAVASSWISLEAPEAEGWLVHKQAFPGDVLVAFNVEENTEWHGWDREPSHDHRPADNISVFLAADEALAQGYRLEVNSRDRRLTVLSRNGVDVASVVQDSSFPIRYVGGHAPYSPRRNRVCLLRQGNRLRAVINGIEVLTYEDPQPLAAPAIAVGGHHTHFNISSLLVRELPPRAESAE